MSQRSARFGSEIRSRFSSDPVDSTTFRSTMPRNWGASCWPTVKYRRLVGAGQGGAVGTDCAWTASEKPARTAVDSSAAMSVLDMLSPGDRGFERVAAAGTERHNHFPGGLPQTISGPAVAPF